MGLCALEGNWQRLLQQVTERLGLLCLWLEVGARVRVFYSVPGERALKLAQLISGETLLRGRPRSGLPKSQCLPFLVQPPQDNCFPLPPETGLCFCLVVPLSSWSLNMNCCCYTDSGRQICGWFDAGFKHKVWWLLCECPVPKGGGWSRREGSAGAGLGRGITARKDLRAMLFGLPQSPF